MKRKLDTRRKDQITFLLTIVEGGSTDPKISQKPKKPRKNGKPWMIGRSEGRRRPQKKGAGY